MERTINKVWMLMMIIGMIVLTALLITQKSFGSAPTGLPAVVASSTNITVGSTVGSGAIATSSCSARIISTSGSAVMLTFSDYANQTPTGSFGHLQAASTTVAYDSGQYGCGLVKIYSFTSQAITVTDVR